MQNINRYKAIQNNKFLNFSRWSRKAYAVFLSIGKIVKISNLKAEVSQDFIKKNRTFSAIRTFFNFNKNNQDESPPNIAELLNTGILINPIILINNLTNNCLTEQHLPFFKRCSNIICVNFVYAFFIIIN